jgi:hypothetical protein
VPGDVLDEPLEVVDERSLEELELATVEVEPGQHLGEIGIELPGAVHQLVELGEHRADLAGEHVGIEAVKQPGIMASERCQPRKDPAEHFAGYLACGLGVPEQFLHVSMD